MDYLISHRTNLATWKSNVFTYFGDIQPNYLICLYRKVYNPSFYIRIQAGNLLDDLTNDWFINSLLIQPQVSGCTRFTIHRILLSMCRSRIMITLIIPRASYLSLSERDHEIIAKLETPLPPHSRVLTAPHWLTRHTCATVSLLLPMHLLS